MEDKIIMSIVIQFQLKKINFQIIFLNQSVFFKLKIQIYEGKCYLIKVFVIMRPLIIFGPSGVGKGTIITNLQQRNPDLFKLTLSFTTRQPRKGELHGWHYNFITAEEFEKKLQQNQMLQHKTVFGNMYGTSRKSVQQIADMQMIPVLDVDVEGMLDINTSLDDKLHYEQKTTHPPKLLTPLCLCILPPTYNLLKKRLAGRKTQSEEVVQKRMKENMQQVERMLSLQNNNMPNVFYTTNYQFQLTVYGIQQWLEQRHENFAYYRRDTLQRNKCFL